MEMSLRLLSVGRGDHMRRLFVLLTLPFCLSLSLPKSEAFEAQCHELPTIERHRCDFRESLRTQAWVDSEFGQPLRTSLNSFAGIFGIEYTTNSLTHDVFAPQIMEQIKAYLEASYTDIGGRDSIDPRTFIEGLKLVDQIFADANEDGLFKKQAVFLHLGANKLLLDVLRKQADGRYRIDADLWAAIGDVTHDIETMKKTLAEIKLSENAQKRFKEAALAKIDQAVSASVANAIRSDAIILDLRKQIEAATDVSTQLVIAAKIESRKRDIAKAKEAIAKLALSEAKAAFIISGSVISFFDPQAARAISVVGEATTNIVSALDQLSGIQSAVEGGAILGPYAAIAISVVSIFQLFADQPNPDAVIIGQLQSLSQQLSDVHRDLSKRFDTIEDMVAATHRSLLIEFMKLGQQTQDVQTTLDNISAVLSAVAESVGALDQRIKEYRIEDSNAAYSSFSDNCLQYESYTTIPIADDALVACAMGFANFSTDTAALPWFTSADESVTPDRIARLLAAGDPESYIGFLARSLGYGKVVPNPRVWSAGVGGFLTLQRVYSTRMGIVRRPLVEKLLVPHDELYAFRRFIRSKQSYLLALLQEHGSLHSAVYEDLMSEEAALVERLFSNNLRVRAAEFSALLGTDAQRAPSASVGLCTGPLCDPLAALNKHFLSVRAGEVSQRAGALAIDGALLRAILGSGDPIDNKVYFDHWMEPCAKSKAQGFSQRVHLTPTEQVKLVGNDTWALAELLGIGNFSFCYDVQMGPGGHDSYPSGERTHHLGKVTRIDLLGTFTLQNGDKALVVKKGSSSTHCFDSGDSVFGRFNQIQSFMNGSYQAYNVTRPPEFRYDCPFFDVVIAADNEVKSSVEVETTSPANLLHTIPARTLEYMLGDNIYETEEEIRKNIGEKILERQTSLVEKFFEELQKSALAKAEIVSKLDRINEIVLVASGAVYFYLYQDYGEDVDFRAIFASADQISSASQIIGRLPRKFGISEDMGMVALSDGRRAVLPDWKAEAVAVGAISQEASRILVERFSKNAQPQKYPISETPRAAIEDALAAMQP